MGQQQLLLLVLATVIVGLATVAGIQAFQENQDQARQDALVQRGLDIATQIKAVADKPSQLGGLEYSDSGLSNTDIINAANLDADGSGNISAEGAGSGATCTLSGAGSVTGPGALDQLSITCQTADGGTSVDILFDSDGGVSTSI